MIYIVRARVLELDDRIEGLARSLEALDKDLEFLGRRTRLDEIDGEILGLEAQAADLARRRDRLWVLSRPLSGFAETFSQYIMEVAPGGGSDRPETDPGAEGVLFVVDGTARIVLDGTAHCPMLDRPDALSSTVLDFLATAGPL